MVTLADIALARYRIAPYLEPTPLEPAHRLGEAVWLKLENTNVTRSFKPRGALNAVLSLSEAERLRGLIAASSGNHAQGLAFAAQQAGAQARILMPEHTPARKVEGVRRYGGEAVLFGAGYDAAEAEARRQAVGMSLTFVSAYNDPQVIAGAGTIGLELLDDLPDIARVLVPTGGGGLVSGIAIALKSLRPAVEVVAVNTTHAPALYNHFYGTRHPQVWDTLAEAISGEIEAGSITFELTRRFVDRVVLVTEEAVAEAMRWLVFEQGWVVEGGGAVGVAALLSGVVEIGTQPTIVVVTGGNVDEATLLRVLCPTK